MPPPPPLPAVPPVPKRLMTKPRIVLLLAETVSPFAVLPAFAPFNSINGVPL